MSMDRRSLLKGLAVAGAGASVASTTAAASERAAPPENAVGMLYDATRCIGCRACVPACKKANDLPGNLYDPPNDLNADTKNIIKKLELEDGGYTYMKQQCMHCLDPGCVNACMVGAFKKRDYGIVTWDGSRCIGCRYCQVACPYNVPKFEWGSATPKIVKCELCLHLIDPGGTGEITGEPGCCQACPKDAVIFGTYTDLLADARQRIAEHPERYYPAGDPQIFGDDEGGGTQVLYLAGVDFEKLGLPDLGDKPTAELARTVQHGVYQGFIAPVALYAILGAVIWRNRRKSAAEEEE